MEKEVREKTQRAKQVYGAPTLQLREGMLSIFIKPDASSQVIHFKNLFAQPSSRVGSASNQEGIMDLGSLRSTIVMTDPNRGSLIQQNVREADRKSFKDRTLSSADINSDQNNV